VEVRQPSRFEILPAIDLVGGRVVRLRQGDFDRSEVFSDDPVAVAASFQAAGARWLHVVDLDGARSGRPCHTDVIARILSEVGDRVLCEIAGGLRTEDSVAAVLGAGANRAVLGTAALQNPSLAARLVGRFGTAHIAVAIDVRDGLALGEAWRSGARGPTVKEAVARLVDAGVTVFETTAVGRDGILAGPDLELLESVIAFGCKVIASGGIRSIADLLAVRDIGCTGAIVGRALYDGSLDLAEALAAVTFLAHDRREEQRGVDS
jgi:phosphoribosylformimino-5-aminoimidazole carboxamide ribotide isomerase